MAPTGLAAVLSNVLFSLELTPPSIEIWPLRAIYCERGVKLNNRVPLSLCLSQRLKAFFNGS